MVYMTSNECQNVADAVKEVFSACGVEISAEYPTGDLTDNSSVMVDWLTDIKTKARSKRALLLNCFSKHMDDVQLLGALKLNAKAIKLKGAFKYNCIHILVLISVQTGTMQYDYKS